MKVLQLVSCVTVSIIASSNAFAPLSTDLSRVRIQRHRNSNVLVLGAKKSSNDGSKGGSNPVRARTCVLNFLTQRSLQSFMFLLKTMKDPHTNTWIENFLGSKNLLSYHGSGALDLDRFRDWDSVFNELIDKPHDSVIVEIQARGEGRGLSKNNPYRMQEVSISIISHFCCLLVEMSCVEMSLGVTRRGALL
jgi:hypothetical protein